MNLKDYIGLIEKNCAGCYYYPTCGGSLRAGTSGCYPEDWPVNREALVPVVIETIPANVREKYNIKPHTQTSLYRFFQKAREE